jgi:hypothetical protein
MKEEGPAVLAPFPFRSRFFLEQDRFDSQELQGRSEASQLFAYPEETKEAGAVLMLRILEGVCDWKR